MVAKTSKEVTDQIGFIRRLVTALTQQGPTVAQIALDLTRPHLQEGDPEPDYLSTLNGSVRQLEASATRLLTVDETLYDANALHSALRAELVTTSDKLGGLLVGLRRSVLGQYVAPNVVRLGLEQRTAEDPETILRQGLRVGDTLRRASVGEMLDESLFPEASFNPTLHGGQVADLSALLRDVIRRTDEQKRRVDEALLEKREALGEAHLVYLRSARMFEDLCRLAGKSELAERVRSSVSRPATTSEVDTDPPPAPDPPIEPPSGGEVVTDAVLEQEDNFLPEETSEAVVTRQHR